VTKEDTGDQSEVATVKKETTMTVTPPFNADLQTTKKETRNGKTSTQIRTRMLTRTTTRRTSRPKEEGAGTH
jgi:hypothetical protein